MSGPEYECSGKSFAAHACFVQDSRRTNRGKCYIRIDFWVNFKEHIYYMDVSSTCMCLTSSLQLLNDSTLELLKLLSSRQQFPGQNLIRQFQDAQSSSSVSKKKKRNEKKKMREGNPLQAHDGSHVWHLFGTTKIQTWFCLLHHSIVLKHKNLLISISWLYC